MSLPKKNLIVFNEVGVANPMILVGILIVLAVIFMLTQVFLFSKKTPEPEPSATPVVSTKPEPIPSDIRLNNPSIPKSTSKPTASPSASPTPSPIPSPTVKPISMDGTNTSYNVNVLVMKYFPVTDDGQYIDASKTGDVGDSLSFVRQKTEIITNNLKTIIENASRYLGYKDGSAVQSLHYNIIETREYNQSVPIKGVGNRTSYPDYRKIMSELDICNYVDFRGVREVWLWAYQGPNKADGQPYLGIDEAKMAGPFGDISNSQRYNDMPICNNTYRVYTFNYGRGSSEAFESWGHQLEAELDSIDTTLFRSIFQGSNYPQSQGVNGRCGSVHNPPNARNEYDRSNQSSQKSDCLDWNPDGMGQLSDISCQNWGCVDYNDANNPGLNYMIWNWQNMPGRNNIKTYKEKKLRNWWDIHGNFDMVMRGSRRLTVD